MADKVKSIRIGENIRAKMVGANLILRINLTAKGSPSQSGKAILLAKSGGFASLKDVVGEDIGLNLILSKRAGQKPAAKPAKAKAKPAAKAPAKPAKVKRRAKRDDDED